VGTEGGFVSGRLAGPVGETAAKKGGWWFSIRVAQNDTPAVTAAPASFTEGGAFRSKRSMNGRPHEELGVVGVTRSFAGGV
jgi:hypothetical protein